MGRIRIESTTTGGYRVYSSHLRIIKLAKDAEMSSDNSTLVYDNFTLDDRPTRNTQKRKEQLSGRQ